MILGPQPVELILRNTCPHPLNPTIEHVPGATPALPLSIVVTSFGNPSKPVSEVGVPMPAGTWRQDLPPLEAGAAVATPFEVRLSEMLQPQQASLLKITTDLGTEAWVPVRGFRDDLEN